MSARLRLWCLVLMLVASCARDREENSGGAQGDVSPDAGVMPPSTPASTTLSTLRARFTTKPVEPMASDADKDVSPDPRVWIPLPPGSADRFTVGRDGLHPHFAARAVDHPTNLVLPKRASSPWRLEDLDSGTFVEITMNDLRDVAAESADGYVIYRESHVSGATVLQRPLPTGTEDFISFESPPPRAEVAYQVHLVRGAGALRLVENTLELLDNQGAPRIRVAPPFIVGSDGAIIPATISVEGCTVDSDPAPPWDRPLTSINSDTCTVRITWSSDAVTYPALLDPTWSTTGSMATARQGHSATVLSTGKVLVVGGLGSSGSALSSAELFDRTTGTWAATASISGARQLHRAVQLNTSTNSTTSGKVLVAGGVSGTTSLNTAQLYSPTGGTWTAAATMKAARHQTSATLLANGKVLIAGGITGTTVVSSAEVYDPSSGAGTWTLVGSMASPRTSHTATLLSTANATLSNKVLVVGGSSGSASLTSVQLFDGTSAWTTLTSLSTARERQTATPLANGKVLIAGGRTVTSTSTTILASALLFDPSSGSGSWFSAGTMTAARQQHTATLLSSSIANNGQVLVAGGSNSSTATLLSAELFNGTSSWTATTNLQSATKAHTASLLSNGLVLIAGGLNGTTTLAAAEVYDPSRGVTCTTNSQCVSGFCANGVCCNTTCTNSCFACNLTGTVGTCSPKPNGATCSDGNACTAGDNCQSSTCQPGSTVPIDDNNPCTTDSCDPVAGVKHTPVTNGTACTDSNACTQTDTCQNGTCTGGNPVVCTAIDQCHTAGTCNTSTGVCSSPVKADGTPCNVGNVCSLSQSCQSGTCTGTPSTCVIASFCPSSGGSCCPAGFTNVVLTPNDDIFQTGTSNQCIVGMGGRDNIGAQGGHSIVITGPGDDTIQAANGNNYVAPGAGADTVSTGTGDDTMAIFDICEMDKGKTVDLGTGNNTLIAPLPLADMQAKGLNIANVQNVVVQANSCKSLCSIKPDCNGNGDCQDGAIPGQMGCICHPGFSGPNCEIPPPGTIPPGGKCTGDVDCVTGLVCGNNNGACFGGVRAERRCWKPTCGDGNTAECGQPDSPCGPNCTCTTGCDSRNPQSTCPSREVCLPRMGLPLHAPTIDACLDPRCPSNDPTLCGRPDSLCGPACICTPNCSQATCANPVDGCGGQCPGVCVGGQPGCTSDLNCPAGFSCLKGADGINICRPGACAFRLLVPPLCGSPGALCGDTCPVCTPRCDGRQCGADPNCGQSCGSCGSGTSCNGDGQCVPPTTDPPITVSTPDGGTRPINDLPPLPTTDVGAVKGAFSVTEQGTSEYTVPIEVPPGRAGIEPNLTLTYLASRANEDVGVGWRLDGLSKITRCPNAQSLDKQAGPIRNDTTDHFCFDGKRLEAVPGVVTGTTGKYGETGTEYRTLIDSFARIISFQLTGNGPQLDLVGGITPIPRPSQGPDYFTVYTKDGRILTFGLQQEAIVMGRTGIRYGWLLSRVEDRFGNSMTVHYTNVSAETPAILSAGQPNMVRPSSIFYTGHTSETDSDRGNREVRFSYEARSDPKVSFFQGGVASTTFERLSRITTYLKGDPVKNYHLIYKTDDLSQIEKIFECVGGDDTHCKAPTEFGYQHESGFTLQTTHSDIVSAAQLDANGDGIPDFLSTQVKYGGVSANPDLAAAQITTDLVINVGAQFFGPVAGFAISAWWSMAEDGFWGTFQERPQVTVESNLFIGTSNRTDPSTKLTATGVNPCSYTWIPGSTFFLDYNRDGKDDILAACSVTSVDPSTQNPVGHTDVFVMISQGNGTFTGAGGILLTLPYGVSEPLNSNPQATNLIPLPRPIVYDVDGDSLQDFVSCKDKSTVEVRLRLSPTQAFATTPIALTTPPPPGGGKGLDPLCGSTSSIYRTLDFDGDGSPDLMVRASNGWKILRYKPVPGATTNPLSWQPVNFDDIAGSHAGDGLTTGDFNGDGLADVWAARGDQAVVWLNSGDGHFWSRRFDRPVVQARFNNDFFPMNNTRTAIIDFNGDGRSDVFEQWELGTFAPQHWTRVPDNALAGLTSTQVPLKWPDDFTPPNMIEGRFATSGDLDGDGNLDLIGTRGVFYGSGVRNRLLTRVVDGLGTLTRISYDVPAGNTRAATYETDSRCNGSTWPEICLKKMNGLVGAHEEGFVGANGQDVIERSYVYTNLNGRLNLTGQGWLGFDRRAVTETSPASPPRVITTDYEPVARYDLQGNPTQSTIPPYIYPLAGMARTVTTDYHADNANRIGNTPPPLQSDFFARRTQIANEWRVITSASGRPFPYLGFRTTSTFERQAPAGTTPPFDNNGTQITECSASFSPDSYGNITIQQERCQEFGQSFVERTLTTTTIVPNPSAWLVENPKHVTVQNSRGATTHVQDFEYAYVSNSVETVTRGLNADDKRHKTTYVHNEFGNVQQVIEEVATGEPSRTTDITYDTDNVFPETITNAKSQVTQLRFDARWGTPKTITDANEIVTQSGYDGYGRLAETRSPEGTTIATYSNAPVRALDTAVGHIEPRIEITEEREGADGTPGGSSVNDYDNYGRLVHSSGQGFQARVIQDYAYDQLGRRRGITMPHIAEATAVPKVTYAYDHLDRVVLVTNTGGHSTQFQYATSATLAPSFQHWLTGMSCGGLPVSSCVVDFALGIDEEGRKNLTIGDHRGMIVRSIDGENIDNTQHSSNYKYGAFDQLVEASDNLGFVTSLTYDDYGRRLSIVDPDNGTSRYTYNGFDELTTSTDPKLQVRTYHYDELGRADSIVDPAGATQWSYDQGVNGRGRVTDSISPGTPENPLGLHVHYAYEPPTATTNRGFLSQIDSTIDAVDYTTKFEYDDLGRTSRIRYPDLGNGAPIVAQYGYDPSGMLTKLEEVGGPTAKPIWELKEAFQAHLIQRETFGNGASTTYGYNPDRRWLECLETTFEPNGLECLQTTLGSSAVQALEYVRYHNGNIRFRTDGGTQREHVYDDLNRLSSITDTNAALGTTQTTSYAYDTLGNIRGRGATSITYQADRPHLVNAAGANTYRYDLNGNVIQRSGPDVPGESQTFDYTPFGLPKAIQSGTINTQFEYTADGMRAVRRDPDSTLRFLGSLYQHRVTTGSGSTREERFRLYAGTREIAEIVRAGGADKTLYFHTDALNSVDTITNGQQESFKQTFDPYGMPLDAPSPDLTRSGFTGQEHDRDLGLVDMKGRIYDPLAARFTTPDPIMQAPFWSQGLNRYSYVFNDPVNRTDPSGFDADEVPGYIVGAFVWGGHAVSIGLIAYGFGMPGIGGVALGEALDGGKLLLNPPGQGSPALTKTAMPSNTPVPSSTGRSSQSPHAGKANKGRPGPRRSRALPPAGPPLPPAGPPLPPPVSPPHVPVHLPDPPSFGGMIAKEIVEGIISPFESTANAPPPGYHTVNSQTTAEYAVQVAATVSAGRVLKILGEVGGSVAKSAGAFASGRGAHTALVTVFRDGHIVAADTVVSGSMTVEEAALGFPKSSLATHTEARAVKFGLQEGDTMIIQGQYAPCPACKGAMNKAAAESGAEIHYLWGDQSWTAGR